MSDLIFVLGGLQQRNVFALRLHREGRGRRILFSVDRFHIRRFAQLPVRLPIDLVEIARPITPHQRHLFLLLEGSRVEVFRVPMGPFGTMMEIEALAGFVEERHEIQSVLLVSSQYHLPRVRLCCNHLLPRTIAAEFVGVPRGETPAPTLLQYAQELGKRVLYPVILASNRRKVRYPVFLTSGELR